MKSLFSTGMSNYLRSTKFRKKSEAYVEHPDKQGVAPVA